MDPWNQQLGLTDDCLRACVFADYIGRQKPPFESAWESIVDICYSDAIITWNQIFGQRSQETHWSKFVEKLEIPKGDKLKPFNKDIIISYLGVSEKEWAEYHQSMVDVRNVRIAHLNTDHSLETLPNITKAMHCAYIYRDWLLEAILLANRMGFNFKVSETRAKDAVNTYRAQIEKAYHGL